MKSLEVWRKGYKAEFSPGLGRSKCKVSPLPCFSWDSVGGVGQGQFCILHKSGIASPVLWRSPGLSSGLVCWDGWRHGWSAWAVALSGVQAGRRSFTVIFWPFLSFPSSLPSLCPLSWVLAFLCCPLVLACYALGLGAGLGWGRCWAVQAVAVVAGWGLVCGDLAGLGIVILHKYSLEDLVIFQAKSDKF